MRKNRIKNFNCNFIFLEKIFVFILYLLVNFFKGCGEKYTLNEGGGHSDLMSALRGRVPKSYACLSGGRGGVKKPQKYAYIICERPLMMIRI